jgi:hypothetical protein
MTSSSKDTSEYISSAVSQVELRPDELKLELRYSWLEHTTQAQAQAVT